MIERTCTDSLRIMSYARVYLQYASSLKNLTTKHTKHFVLLSVTSWLSFFEPLRVQADEPSALPVISPR
jgi:hypothetical protein